MCPDTIILDVSNEVIAFHNATFNLLMFGELTREEIVRELFEYLCDQENAYGNLLEYVRSIQEQFANRHYEVEIAEFGNALRIFGVAMIEYLEKALKAYNPERALWYKFKEFVGDDIVLERATSEDFIN